MSIRLGVIGLSEGNGHPYSWSAIFNGYDKSAMESCGFPVIPRYLEEQFWPQAQIGGAHVAAVWTQDFALSKHIAMATGIETVCENLEDLALYVDAVLLARDDAENHLAHARRFLELGLPVYIDKPLALSLKDLHRLYDLEQSAGQLFTCSALRYSDEFKLTEEDRETLGDVRQIIAFTPKSWAKYAVHIIEPVLNMLAPDDAPIGFNPGGVRLGSGGASSLSVDWSSGVHTAFYAAGNAASPLVIRVHGSRAWKDLFFTDSFSAFRAALQDFVEGVETRTVRSPKARNERVIQILERGLA
ncbi:dehydrogenase [Salinisphaera dokdonensis CL-ES53]|uniref:Dehydrogenase n=1 Tax=Salinisphaera dokdonensis CL-ES53 TaxID=1304272 RepID=A0ABV2AVU1_9GAMM